MEPDIKDTCNGLRAQIKKVGDSIKSVHQHHEFDNEQSSNEQHSEMHANITLAYRHIEDARMRLGKVIQAYEGGVSIFDK